MGRKKKVTNTEEVVKKEAPKVETNLIINKPIKEDKKEEIVEPTNDLISGDKVDETIVKEVKQKLFEPCNLKTIQLNRYINRKEKLKKIGQIKIELTQRPMVSRYRGSRSKPNSNNTFGLSFKIGR